MTQMNIDLMQEAEAFIRNCHKELDIAESKTLDRLSAIKQEIVSHGTYEPTYEELEQGAKVAWRNSNRCIGRLFWNRLNVVDARNAKEEAEIFEAILDHITSATSGGKIVPTITIFKPEREGQQPVRIWNHQLLRYAGYESENGVIGDPASLSFTKVCMELGWKGEGTAFDLLPLVIQINGNQPRWFDIPEDKVMEVPIRHPRYSFFENMNVRWYAVPIISDMMLEIGGIRYVAAPFNGWYMGTEIGARNLADENRYHLLPEVAKGMGLDTTKNASLWKDQALVELNIAVLDSFKKHGVSIVDHHTAAQQFKMFEQNEAQAGRDLTGRWSWLIPPVSPATTAIFHNRYEDSTLKPNYFYQEKPY